MTQTPQQEFTKSLSTVSNAEQAFSSLHTLTNAVVGSQLFMIMCVDMEKMEAYRPYTSDAQNYAVAGTKPVKMNDWFQVVYIEGRPFVANTLAEMAKVFPDHELIGSLGYGSVVNLPIVVESQFVATLNILHETDYYTAERVRVIERELLLPFVASWLLYSRLRKGSKGVG